MRGWCRRLTTNIKRTMDSARHCAWNVSCAMRNLSLSPIYYACWSQQPHRDAIHTYRCERDDVHHAVHKCLDLNVYAPVPLFLSSVEAFV